jgi:hypothetical protein
VTPDDGAVEGPSGIAGVEIAAWSGPVDILLVFDTSASMQLEAAALARALDGLEEGLADAAIGDWRLGVTTTSVYWNEGASANIDPGEAGTLVGGAMVDSVALAREALLCQATCWSPVLPADPGYQCGDPLEGDVSEDYLDCLCGPSAWRGNCGTGIEQGLEASYLAQCRAAEAPPAECYAFPPDAPVAFQRGQEGSNAGLRSDARTVVVIVSDEGDSSSRTTDPDVSAGPGDVDEVVATYAALFRGFASSVRVGTFGPAWDGVNGDCLDGAQPWSVERYQGAALLTDGFYASLTNPEDDCASRPFSELLPAVIAAAQR